MELLEKNEHPHPLILMRGFKFEDLNALVDNTYKGEVTWHKKGGRGSRRCKWWKFGWSSQISLFHKNKRTGQWYKGHDEVQSKSYEHKREKTRICRMCGKEGRLFAIKRHIEAMHISGISHPWELCDKISLSRDRLGRHKAVYHE